MSSFKRNYTLKAISEPYPSASKSAQLFVNVILGAGTDLLNKLISSYFTCVNSVNVDIALLFHLSGQIQGSDIDSKEFLSRELLTVAEEFPVYNPTPSHADFTI